MDETIQIPGYTVEKKIGSGAMATVYLAIQNTLERRVALKIMSSSLQEDDTFQKRFLKEGKIIAQLTHPNIVTIYDIGVVDSHNYMAMEYVDGGMTLSDKIIPHYGMPPEQAILSKWIGMIARGEVRIADDEPRKVHVGNQTSGK